MNNPYLTLQLPEAYSEEGAGEKEGHPGDRRRKERWHAFLQGSPPQKKVKVRDIDSPLKNTVSHLLSQIKEKANPCLSSERTENSRVNIDAAMGEANRHGRDRTATSPQSTCKVGAEMSHTYVIYMQNSPVTGRGCQASLPTPPMLLKLGNSPLSVTHQGQVCLRTPKLS